MKKNYPLNMSFMGHALLIELEEGVYGEYEHRNQLDVEHLQKRLADFVDARLGAYAPQTLTLGNPAVVKQD